MKTSIVLSAILSFGVLGLAGGFIAGKLAQDARAVAGSNGGADLAVLEERLAALEKGIEALGDLRSDIDALKRLPRAPSEPTVEVAIPDEPEEEKATVALALREDEELPPTKLERWLDGQGMRGEFDDLVSKVYEKARTARIARERTESEERAREMEALSQGPYGKYNYQVNSLSKKLALDARQEQYVHSLLLGLEERRRQAMEQLPKLEGEVTPDQLKEHRTQIVSMHQELGQQFERDLLAGLDAGQQEIYENMPEHERLAGNLDSVKMISLEGGGMVGATGMRLALPMGTFEKPVEVKIKAPAPTPAPAK
jgi:hypothetical protein